jgi:hypothetical protein
MQPVGVLVIEYLLQHFADCFSYDYTKSMEDELDVISSRESAEAQRTWHEICRKCFDDITERSRPLNKQTKQTCALSDTADNVLVFNTYGASIKSIVGGGFTKIRPDIELDLEKAKRGEYAMAELIWREDNGCLGEYNGAPVYLKKGKFGLYAEYGIKKTQKPQTISLAPLDKPANKILLEDVIRLIESKPTTMDKAEAAAMFLPQSVFGEEENTIANMGEGSGEASAPNRCRGKTEIRTHRFGCC